MCRKIAITLWMEQSNGRKVAYNCGVKLIKTRAVISNIRELYLDVFRDTKKDEEIYVKILRDYSTKSN